LFCSTNRLELIIFHHALSDNKRFCNCQFSKPFRSIYTVVHVADDEGFSARKDSDSVEENAIFTDDVVGDSEINVTADLNATSLGGSFICVWFFTYVMMLLLDLLHCIKTVSDLSIKFLHCM
jgi:hypothetical protein